MTKIVASAKSLADYVSSVVCSGTLDASTPDESGTKIKSTKGSLCEKFTISADKRGLVVSARDTITGNVYVNNILKIKAEDNAGGVEILEEGNWPVSDVDDVQEALSGFKNNDRVTVTYPDEEAGVKYIREVDGLGFRHGIDAVSKIPPPVDSPIMYDEQLKMPVGKKGGQIVLRYEDFVTLPSTSLKEVEQDIARFIKKSLVTIKIVADPFSFTVNEGSPKAGRGGWRPLVCIFVDQTGKKTFAKSIEEKYSYGLGAVLKNLDGIVNIFFGKIPKGWCMWFRTDSPATTLNYLVPSWTPPAAEAKKEEK
jgi:hypothetical protein